MESIKYIMIFLMIATATYLFSAAMKENDDRFYTRNSTITIDDFKSLDGISEIKEKEQKIFISVNKGGQKLKLENHEKAKKEEISPENCDRNVRLGKKGEFGVFPFISFPGSGNT